MHPAGKRLDGRTSAWSHHRVRKPENVAYLVCDDVAKDVRQREWWQIFILDGDNAAMSNVRAVREELRRRQNDEQVTWKTLQAGRQRRPPFVVSDLTAESLDVGVRHRPGNEGELAESKGSSDLGERTIPIVDSLTHRSYTRIILRRYDGDARYPPPALGPEGTRHGHESTRPYEQSECDAHPPTVHESLVNDKAARRASRRLENRNGGSIALTSGVTFPRRPVSPCREQSRKEDSWPAVPGSRRQS